MTRKLSLRMLLVGSTALLAVAGGTVAMAAEASEATKVEEVTVTAEKRSANIQKVANSVSAIKGDKLVSSGAQSLKDYAQFIPGLTIQDAGTPGQAVVTLRGIAPFSSTNTIATLIDDVSAGASNGWARATVYNVDLIPYDLDRFEVLRGPQGTLYGASTIGGLLKYNLKPADVTGFSAQLGGELSNTSKGSGGPGYLTRGAVNIPVVNDVFAVRLSAYNRYSEGWIKATARNDKNANEGNDTGARLAATFKPNDKFRINLQAMYNKSDYDDTASVRFAGYTSYKAGGVRFYRETGAEPLSNSDYYPHFFKRTSNFYSGTINWDLDWATLTSITASVRDHLTTAIDTTNSYGQYLALFGLPFGKSFFALDIDMKKFTQEVRLTSPSGGRFEWLLGAFYTKEDIGNEQIVKAFKPDGTNLAAPFTNFSTKYFLEALVPSIYKEKAVFANASFKITDELTVSGGIRRAQNDQDFHQVTDGIILGGFKSVPGGSGEKVTTWSTSASYQFTPRIMSYVRVATGYMPGGPNALVANSIPEFSSSTVTNYEVGFKSTFWDGRALFNAALYKINWKDIQLIISDPNCGCTYFGNGGRAYSKGFEFEGYVIPTEGLRVGFNGSFNKNELTSLDPGSPPFEKGYQLPNSPKFNGSLFVDYDWAVHSDWRATVGASYQYVDDRYSATVNRYNNPNGDKGLNGIDPAYSRLNLHAGLTAGRYTVNLNVRNALDDRDYVARGLVSPPLAGSPYMTATPLTPRTISLSVDAKF